MAGMIAQVRDLGIEQIIPNPDQPRKTFHPEALEEMAQSITQDGVRQPIEVVKIEEAKIEYLKQRFSELVAEYPSDIFFQKSLKTVTEWDKKTNLYLIVYGERRWRGSILAAKKSAPAIVRKDMDEKSVATIALLENMQREGVGFIEEARAMVHWMQMHGLDPENTADRKTAAARLGKSPTFVHWRLDAMLLEPYIQKRVDEGALDANQVCHLAWTKDPEKRQKLFRMIESGKCKTHVQLEAAVKALNENADDARAQLGLNFAVKDKTKAIALTKEVEALAYRMVKLNATAEGEVDEASEALKQMELGELQHLAKLFQNIEKMARSIHKNKIVYHEQAHLASQIEAQVQPEPVTVGF